jgi:hypothetical protein
LKATSCLASHHSCQQNAVFQVFFLRKRFPNVFKSISALTLTFILAPRLLSEKYFAEKLIKGLLFGVGSSCGSVERV